MAPKSKVTHISEGLYNIAIPGKEPYSIRITKDSVIFKSGYSKEEQVFSRTEFDQKDLASMVKDLGDRKKGDAGYQKALGAITGIGFTVESHKAPETFTVTSPDNLKDSKYNRRSFSVTVNENDNELKISLVPKGNERKQESLDINLPTDPTQRAELIASLKSGDYDKQIHALADAKLADKGITNRDTHLTKLDSTLWTKVYLDDALEKTGERTGPNNKDAIVGALSTIDKSPLPPHDAATNTLVNIASHEMATKTKELIGRAEAICNAAPVGANRTLAAQQARDLALKFNDLQELISTSTGLLHTENGKKALAEKLDAVVTAATTLNETNKINAFSIVDDLNGLKAAAEKSDVSSLTSSFAYKEAHKEGAVTVESLGKYLNENPEALNPSNKAAGQKPTHVATQNVAQESPGLPS